MKQIAVFQGKRIRKVLIDNVWWFAINDVVEILTDTPNPQDYIKKMRKRDEELGKGWGQIVTPLSIKTEGGVQKLNCANTEGMFRIIQSIPSPKAEPFKRWLAKVGRERVEEIENPELGMQRTKALYKKKGYPKDWIEKRLRGIAVRQKLTDEWDSRGADTDKDYAILTNEIMRGAFEIKVDNYKKHKGLQRENLRDHMTDLELIITMLGEATTTHLTNNRDSRGMPKLKRDAKDGGDVAGRTRKDIELRTGATVISKKNFLQGEKRKQIRGK
ncbi:MAG: Bro-N domain-containing protein [Candidatus Omnitrophica bacterium]|nr:Bro-N domain-containing protein [Candidatus Omnitrophota bacterium]MCK4423312.1 Bro-N domain-containing protein [Candidatus Omnitrophota bacterium]